MFIYVNTPTAAKTLIASDLTHACVITRAIYVGVGVQQKQGEVHVACLRDKQVSAVQLQECHGSGQRSSAVVGTFPRHPSMMLTKSTPVTLYFQHCPTPRHFRQNFK